MVQMLDAHLSVLDDQAGRDRDSISTHHFSHTMKIFKGINDHRIRIHDVVQLTTHQEGFISGCGTRDALNSSHLLKKHR